MTEAAKPKSKTASSRKTTQAATRVPRRGRPTGDHEAKRNALLQAAIAVIAEDGYTGASMRKVAKQANCTTGAVTYYFANKEEIITAAAQQLFDRADAVLNQTDEQVDVRSLIEDFLNWMGSEKHEGWLAWFQMLAHARHEAAFASVIRQRYANFRQQFTALIKLGQQQGSVRKDVEAELLADQLSALSDGWMMMMPIEPERFGTQRTRALIDTVITLISPLPHK